MKIAGKKIPKGNVLLFLSFTAVSLCLLLIVSAVRAEKINRLNKYAMYSGHQKGFSVMNGKGVEQWEEVITELTSRDEHFSIYVPMEDPQIIVKGICTTEDAGEIPMLWGNYFNFSTSWTDTPTAVLGKQYEKDIVERDGKRYFSFNETEFEVIGIMGTEHESRINLMLLIDFKSAVRITGVSTDYVLDADKSEISVIGRQISDQMPFPSEVWINLEDESNISLRGRFLAPDVILDTMYVMILVSFSLCTVLVTLVWLRFRRQLFFAWKLCGYEGRSEWMEICRRFYMITGAGFVMGLVIVFVIAGTVSEIHMVFRDVLRAFVVTVGLGTVILFPCCSLEHRKSSLR